MCSLSRFAALAAYGASTIVSVAASSCADDGCRAPHTALSMVQRDASRVQVVQASNVSGDGGVGDSSCPCVGIGFADGRVNVRGVEFAAGLGSQCEAWEEGAHPLCDGSHSQPSWCSESWCYVDPCNCDIGDEPLKSFYFPGASFQGKSLRFSYTTCGSPTSWTPQHQRPEPLDDEIALCPDQHDESACTDLSYCRWSGSDCGAKDSGDECAEHVHNEEVLGKEGCECVGIKGMVGTMKGVVHPLGKEQFPADIGGSCQAWDSASNPGCESDGTQPHWCNLKFCYVDPCTCNLAVPAMKSSYFPLATFQGKPLYYSYQTCGNDYEWDMDNNYTSYAKDCVQQEDETGCSGNAECAWINGMCREKELEGACFD